MKKINMATAAVLIATAVLLVILFVLTLNVFNLMSKDSQDKDTAEQVATVIGLALMLILGLPVAFTWLIAAVIFLVFGIIRFVKNGLGIKSNTTSIVLVCVFGVIFALSLWWFMPIYSTFSVPVVIVGVVTALGYVACLVLSILYGKVFKRQTAATVSETLQELHEQIPEEPAVENVVLADEEQPETAETPQKTEE